MAWLYVPGMVSRCAPDMADSNSECALHSETVTELSVSSRGTLLRPASLQRGWRKGRWSKFLSGMTLPPSPDEASLDAWISSLRQRGCHMTPFGGIIACKEGGYATASTGRKSRRDV